MRLYHATKSADSALDIEDNGFRGNDVWSYKNVVFLASRPLPGFGGWRSAWVAVDVPDDQLDQGAYEEKWWDDKQYRADCYCFPAELINQFPREVFLDRVPGFDENGFPDSDEVMD